MILLAWLGRLLDLLAVICSRAADVVYKPYFRHENRRALATERRQAAEELIAETRPVVRVGSHLHRGR
jgi:hypothetical protein